MKNSKKKIDKIDKDTLEKFAKDKNIDKNKIEDIANSYQGKSEDELLDELIKISEAEIQDKINSKKAKNKKSASHHSSSGKKTVKKVKRVKKG